MRREIEIFAPDERREIAQETPRRRPVAGAGARLDQGGAFPVPAAALVIMQRGGGRDRDLGRGRIGPQPQIDAEHVAVAGALLQKLHETARQPHEERPGSMPGASVGAARIEEHDQIDVARKVELAGAHLAHRQHDTAGSGLGIVPGPAATSCPRRDRLAQADSARRRRPRCRQRRSARAVTRITGQTPPISAQRDQQRGFRLHAAKHTHDVGLRCAPRRLPRRGLGEQAPRCARRDRRSSSRTSRAGSACTRSHR